MQRTSASPGSRVGREAVSLEDSPFLFSHQSHVSLLQMPSSAPQEVLMPQLALQLVWITNLWKICSNFLSLTTVWILGERVLRYSITICTSHILSHASSVWDMKQAQQATSDCGIELRDRNQSIDSYPRIFWVHVRHMILWKITYAIEDGVLVDIHKLGKRTCKAL